MPPMLDECIEFLEKRANFLYEIIIVSDGSTDKTVEVANGYSKRFGTEKVRVLALERNRGKGGAVRLVSLRLFIIIPLMFMFKGDAECQRSLTAFRRCGWRYKIFRSNKVRGEHHKSY